MNRRHKLIAISAVCVLLIAATLFASRLYAPRRPTFNGSRIRSETQYILDFTALNGTQTHAIKLTSGDELRCRWSIDRGTVDILIDSEHNGKLYQGNQIDQADFVLTAAVTDDYRITVTGENAQGLIEIDKLDPSPQQ